GARRRGARRSRRHSRTGCQSEGRDPRTVKWMVMTVPTAPPSDEELAARAAGGDEAAFASLVGRHQRRVFQLASRLTADDGDAADALQETFLQVYRHLPEFR